MSKFEIGKTYRTRSVCDHDCIIDLYVVNRSEKTLKARILDQSDFKTLRIKEWDGVEQVKPWGNYSMCPIISADRVVCA